MLFFCVLCGDLFASQQKLNDHYNRVFSCISGKWPCRKCPKRFQHRSGRDRHQRQCTGPRNLQTLQTQLQTIAQVRDNIGNVDAAVGGGERAASAETPVETQELDFSISNVIEETTTPVEQAPTAEEIRSESGESSSVGQLTEAPVNSVVLPGVHI